MIAPAERPLTAARRESQMSRSRRKKANKERQGRTGKRVKVGSHLQEPVAGARCPGCDGDKHSLCIRGVHCYRRVRGPPGTNKRKDGARARPRSRTACEVLLLMILLVFPILVCAVRRARAKEGSSECTGYSTGFASHEEWAVSTPL